MLLKAPPPVQPVKMCIFAVTGSMALLIPEQVDGMPSASEYMWVLSLIARPISTITSLLTFGQMALAAQLAPGMPMGLS
jgi:uncharacterized membrane protein YwaF